MKNKSKLIRISRRIFQALAYIIFPIMIFVLVGWIAGVLYVFVLLILDAIAGIYAYLYEKGRI